MKGWMYSFNLTEDADDLWLTDMLFDDRTHMRAAAVCKAFSKLHIPPLTLGTVIMVR